MLPSNSRESPTALLRRLAQPSVVFSIVLRPPDVKCFHVGASSSGSSTGTSSTGTSSTGTSTTAMYIGNAITTNTAITTTTLTTTNNNTSKDVVVTSLYRYRQRI
jgi:hypothetical protein